MMTLFFIYARRFAKELSVLTQIEKDCGSDLTSMLKRINDFFQEDPNLNDIKQFVNDIYESKQHICYFDDLGLAWTEVSQETKGDVSRAICNQMITEWNYSEKKLEQYQKKYPGRR